MELETIHITSILEYLMFAVIMINPCYNLHCRCSQPGCRPVEDSWKLNVTMSVYLLVSTFSQDRVHSFHHIPKRIQKLKNVKKYCWAKAEFIKGFCQILSMLQITRYYLIKQPCDIFAWQGDKYSSFLVNTTVCNLIPQSCDMNL